MNARRRRLHFVWLFTLLVSGVFGCAHNNANLVGQRVDLYSIDVIDAEGKGGDLGFASGHVVVIDICTASLSACIGNASALHHACMQLCDRGALFVSILFDEVGPEAVRSYREALGFRHLIFQPGPSTREGRSALGVIEGIPDLFIVDAEGVIVERVGGALVDGDVLLRRVGDMVAKDS